MSIRDEELFEKAEKIEAKDYEGWVYWSELEREDRYFDSIKELFAYCDVNKLERPTWVWACNSERLMLNADSILEDALQEHHEDARDWISAEEEARLQTLLDEWASKQNVVTYHCDTSKAVVLPKA